MGIFWRLPAPKLAEMQSSPLTYIIQTCWTMINPKKSSQLRLIWDQEPALQVYENEKGYHRSWPHQVEFYTILVNHPDVVMSNRYLSDTHMLTVPGMHDATVTPSTYHENWNDRLLGHLWLDFKFETSFRMLMIRAFEWDRQNTALPWAGKVDRPNGLDQAEV